MAGASLWAHQEELAALARRRPLGLMIDFDGVLAELALSPAEARLSPACARLLAQLARCLPLVAVISGRPVQELVGLVGLEGLAYFGLHGLERWSDGRVVLPPKAASYRASMVALLGSLGPALPSGVLIEDKGLTLALHYRQALDPAAARQAILAALATVAPELPVGEGKMVVEVRATSAADKGTTVAALARDYGLRSAIYLGDDRTDLDAFAALRELSQRTGLRSAALAVAGTETPTEVLEAADFTLDGVAEVARFLAWLVEAVCR